MTSIAFIVRPTATERVELTMGNGNNIPHSCYLGNSCSGCYHSVLRESPLRPFEVVGAVAWTQGSGLSHEKLNWCAAEKGLNIIEQYALVSYH